MRRIGTFIMLTLLLVSSLALTFSIRQVLALGTVYIRADGSIDPSTAPILRNGSLYIMMGNLDAVGNGIVIERNNMTLDGAGYTVCDWSGANYTIGVCLDGISNVTVENIGIKQFWYGIYLNYSSSHNNVMGNNVMATHDSAVYLNESAGNVIMGNDIANDGVGITLMNALNNSIKENEIASTSSFGINLEGNSSYNSILRNDITDIDYSWGIWDASNYNIISGNNMTAIGHIGYGYYSILVSGANNIIMGNNVKRNDNGIIVGGANNVVVENNVSANFHIGISPDEGTNNMIFGNDITYNQQGIIFIYSSNIKLRNNTINYNKYNFGVCGGVLSDFINDVDSSNTVDNKPVCYWVNKHDIAVPNDCGCLCLVNCTNITVEGLSLENNSQGILLCSTISSNITKCEVANNEDGIWLNGSSQDRIFENNITSNNGDGIHLEGSPNNVVSENYITSNNNAGILLSTSGTTVYENNITLNRYGIQVSESNNSICHNNFINNSNSAWVSSESSNVWDNGYPSGGNYWSNYLGVDQKSGPYQNVAGSDGIGDTPYVIDSNNTDRYPLMEPYPWSSHDIAITSVAPYETITGQGYGNRINIKVLNLGEFAQTFNVTLYANTTAIAIQTVTLTRQNSTIINFTWDTASFAKGNYTLWAYASPVPGETYTVNNKFTYGTVKVTIPGDVDGDFHVTILDLVKITSIYASKLGDLKFNPNCDIDGDGRITILDVVECTSHYGQRYP